MKRERTETQSKIHRWRGALGKHGAKDEQFLPEMLSIDTSELLAVLNDQASAGNSDNRIASEVSGQVLKLIATYDPDHYKKRYADDQKQAVHHTTVTGWRKLVIPTLRMDYRIVAAIQILYDVDVSIGRVFSPMLQGRLPDYRAVFTAELRSNDPTGIQQYDLLPDPVSILKSTVTVKYQDGKTGEARLQSFQIATFNARLSVRLMNGEIPNRDQIAEGWFDIREENLDFKNVLVASDGPVRPGDLFSLDFAPKGDGTELHQTFQGLTIRPVKPWFTLNVASDTVIEWTLLAPTPSVRITQAGPIEDDVERLKAIIRSAMIRAFLTEQSAFPDHVPLAASTTNLNGARTGNESQSVQSKS